MNLQGRHYATGQRVEIAVDGSSIASVTASADDAGASNVYVAPALFDSQVNGFGGRDLNAENTSPEDVAAVMRLLWESGVTRWCPTVTTHSFERMAASLRAIERACESDPQVAHSAVCSHIEGPYISSEDGPRGAHPRDYARPPNWDEFRRLQEAAGGRIGYVTLAPELPGAPAFIQRLIEEGAGTTRDGRQIVVALGHHAGTSQQIAEAVEAGARHCTHLGNGAHAQLPRHPNYIWDQLAEDRLSAGIIADGHHLPPAVVKSFVRAKGLERTILVSDAIAAAGLPPGRYESGKGTPLEITPTGRIQVADTPYLAGSGLRLHEGIGNAVRFAGITLDQAITLASENPARLFGIEREYARIQPGASADLLLFRWDEAAATVTVLQTIAAGEVVYST
jgi:N-acetylglucosamine-6-phosphate deacetylase